jgi:hypothetical protein
LKPDIGTLRLRLENVHSAVEAQGAPQRGPIGVGLRQRRPGHPLLVHWLKARVEARAALEQVEELSRVLEEWGE